MNNSVLRIILSLWNVNFIHYGDSNSTSDNVAKMPAQLDKCCNVYHSLLLKHMYCSLPSIGTESVATNM